MFTQTPVFLSKPNHGFIEPLDNRFALTPAQIQDLLDGRYYVDHHSTTYPGGMVRGQLVPAPNNTPPMTSLVSPADNATIINRPDATPYVLADWTSVTDPENDRVAYLWQLSRDETFSNSAMLYNVWTGAPSFIGVPGDVMDALLASDGVALNSTKKYHHRALAHDGSTFHRTFYDERAIFIRCP